MTNVEIISGFLGAGKTTWIKKLLNENDYGDKVMLIENEFGEIGVDSGFLQEAGIKITELNSGCICCTLVGDFHDALTKAIQQQKPSMIIIEPSGVGKLSDILKAVSEVDDINILGSVTIVDAKKAKMYLKNFAEFFVDQIKHANIVVLSHVNGLANEKVEETRKIIEDINNTAKIVTTDWDKFESKEVMDLLGSDDEFMASLLAEVAKMPEHHHHHEEEHDEDECCCGHHHRHEEEECCCGHHHDEDECCCHHHEEEHDEDECCCGHHHHHHDEDECCCHHEHDADEVFETWGRETAKAFDKEQFIGALNEICNSPEYQEVLRVKGFVSLTNGEWLHFDYIPGELDTKIGPAMYTGKICIIGSELDDYDFNKLFGVE